MMGDSALLEAITSRRSIRRYRPDPVPQLVIETVLTAATWAASAHNRQPWRFCVIQSAEHKERLARAMGDRLRRDLEADGTSEEVIAADTGRSYSRITSAPVLIALCLSLVDMDHYPDARRNDKEFIMAVQSTAMAGQNLLLAAHDQGLGACWMCAPLFCPDVVSAALDLPVDWQPQALITLGYPAETKEKTRRPLETGVVWR
ncbi:MAG: nitroreductase family protein [Chloroflexi bacterium]|uniref:nitroreductase family protein n=1 Tax=Candidatus Flexifilum breve TaxID=3140694 RepID=UPI0031358DE8|nr:nitroreductase family protein [Chloroflexota bacterium]